MISQNIGEQMRKGSWIRKMFEEGTRLKKERGNENVFDFSLGNPDLPPPPEVTDAISKLCCVSGIHGYMPNAGFSDVRKKIAAYLFKRHNINFSENDIIMTVGASGAINVTLKSILSVGDEVIVIAPYFMEYRYYIENYKAEMIPVRCSDDFSLSVKDIEAAITPKTRAIIINSPNNPSGKIYSEKEYIELARVIGDREICVISDEPYSKIIFDELQPPSVFKFFKYCVVADSFSKSLSLAGERIGYLAVSPDMPDKSEFLAAAVFSNRILGFVNAPALFQHIAADFIDISPNCEEYKRRSDYMYNALIDIGYSCKKPQGTFYLFPKSPIDDDKFAAIAIKHGLIVVPGKGFGYPGYFRLSLCMPIDRLKKAVPLFAAVFKEGMLLNG